MAQVAVDSGVEGRSVLVTGAGSGIGRAVAVQLASAGANVLAVGRTESRLMETASAASGARGKVAWMGCDVRNPGEVDRALDYASQLHGPLYGAFNNAGTFGRFGPLHEDDEDNFSAVVDTNLRGLWVCLRAQLVRLLDSDGGSIVNCASVAAHLGHAGGPVYSATKHAIVGLSKSVALQYAERGVRVNVVSPGSTDTPMLRSLYHTEEALDARRRRAPLRRLGRPDDVASAVLWLLDAGSSYVTGQTVVVDGGVTAGSS